MRPFSRTIFNLKVGFESLDAFAASAAEGTVWLVDPVPASRILSTRYLFGTEGCLIAELLETCSSLWTRCQGPRFLVAVAKPALCSPIRRFKSLVDPM